MTVSFLQGSQVGASPDLSPQYLPRREINTPEPAAKSFLSPPLTPWTLAPCSTPAKSSPSVGWGRISPRSPEPQGEHGHQAGMRGSGPLGEPIRILRWERARAPCTVKRRLAPAGTAIPQHATKSEIKLSAAVTVQLRSANPQAHWGWWGGTVSSAAPPPSQPCPPGPLTAWPGLPGAAARPGRVVRALSLGRKRKRADGRGALARRLLCGDPRLRAPGVRGRRGGISAARHQPRSERVPAAAALRCAAEAEATGPRASTIVQEPGVRLAPPSPPSRPPAPGDERAAPGGWVPAAEHRAGRRGRRGELRGRGGGDR
jgi:hypothetical protein